MQWVVAFVVLSVCALPRSVQGATGAVEWCYQDRSCAYPQWPTIAPKYCNGSRQSPININSESATADSSLGAFTFVNYESTTALINIINTGKTVKVELDSGVRVSGGGLSEPYDSLQFHLHWGNGVSSPGSEHTVDGKRYPMELHIVNSKSSYNRNTTLAIADSTGLAALGFMIEASSGTSGQPVSWKTLTSYLSTITEQGQSATIAAGISLDDLLQGVDRSSYYRYLGSLTTPTCNEAVVWTVFKESIKVSQDLIDMFSTTLHTGNSSSPIMKNVFRGLQLSLPVTTQASTSSSSASSSASKACYSLGLMALSLAMGRN